METRQSIRHGDGWSQTGTNLKPNERWISALSGAALMAYGMRKPSWKGALLTLGGGSLFHRAISGHCLIYDALGFNSNKPSQTGVVSVRHNQGIKIERSIWVNTAPAETYRFWRNFENLPRFMKNVESVTITGSHWVVKGPAGMRVEWDAEIYNEVENEMIAWRSLENADVNHAGSVHFEPAGSGTQVRVVLNYEPPAGKAGAAIAKLFGEEPERQIEEDLQRFKEVMELGHVTGTQTSTAGAQTSTMGQHTGAGPSPH
jgi:uncharacterized membrane protein